MREDEDSVFYSVVVPGFSDIAITGSRELPEPVFQVTDLVIAPVSPTASEELTISARVTNTGSNRAVYPASLWINDTIEAARAINVGPGQSVTFQFTFRKPEGEYRVRVERLLGSVRVQSARVATATPAAEATPAAGPEAPPAPEPTATQTPAPPATPTTAPPIPPHATPTPAPTLTPTSVPTAAPRATPPPPAAAAAPLAPTPISVPAPAVPAAPAPPAKPLPAPEPEVVTPRERGGGVSVVIILGFIGAIAVAGAGVAIYLRSRGAQPPAARVAPEGDEPPDAPADGPPASAMDSRAAREDAAPVDYGIDNPTVGLSADEEAKDVPDDDGVHDPTGELSPDGEAKDVPDDDGVHDPTGELSPDGEAKDVPDDDGGGPAPEESTSEEDGSGRV